MRKLTEKELEEASGKVIGFATDPNFMSEAQSDEAKDYHYTEQAKQSYVSAVRKVYDGKNEDIINLMNGIVEEQRKDKDKLFNDAISNLRLIPYGLVNIINMALNTTYTDKDIESVIEQDVLSAKQHLKEYVEKTREEKRKLTKVEEVRKELDEAKIIVDMLSQAKTGEKQKEEQKPTIWQKVKKLFCFKKCDKR